MCIFYSIHLLRTDNEEVRRLLFDKMSPNGQWTTQAMQGSVVIFNRVDSVFYVYGEKKAVLIQSVRVMPSTTTELS